MNKKPAPTSELSDLYVEARRYLRRASPIPLTPGEEARLIRRLVRQSLGVKETMTSTS
jgi:hypothetical protein